MADRRLYEIDPSLKAGGLRSLTLRRTSLDRERELFRDAVRSEIENGATVREVADAAGYKSPSPVQNILKDKSA